MKTRTILILLGLAALGGVAYETGIVNAMMEKREAAAAKRAAPPEDSCPGRVCGARGGFRFRSFGSGDRIARGAR